MNILDFNNLSDNFPGNFFEESFELELYFKPILVADTMINSIGTLHCNKFSTFIYALKNSISENPNYKRKIIIHFANDCTNYDITLIGIIALFRISFPTIEFEIKLPYDEGGGVHAKFRDNLFFIKNWYLNLTHQNLFSVYNEVSLLSQAKEPNSPSQLIFLITQKTFYEYFVSTDSSWDATKLFESVNRPHLAKSIKNTVKDFQSQGESQADTNYRIFRYLVKEYNNKIQWGNNNRLFYQEYLKMLCNFDLSNEVFKKFRGDDFEYINLTKFTKGGFKELEMSRLKDGFQGIINRLLPQPSFFIFLFSFLVNRNIGTVIIRDEIKDEKIIKNKVIVLLDRLNELFEFTKNLFLGIREIARNIIDHTETKTGILTARVYSANSLFEIKGRDNLTKFSDQLSKYSEELDKLQIENFNNQDKYFLDLTIFDEGKDGVISKTISNIKNLSFDDIENMELYAKDILQLSTGEITFSDFFNTKQIKLYHHAVKTASHWGLIIFSNLINKNRGFLYASSRNFFDPRIIDSFQSFFESIFEINNEINPFSIGTYINIILPLDRTQGLIDETKQILRIKEPNFSATNYHTLLNYRYVYDLTVADEKEENLLIQFRISDFLNEKINLIYRSEIDVADQVGQKVKELYLRNKFFIPVLDFENCSDDFDQSKLLRFLGKLQLTFDIGSLIITNVKAINILPLKDIVNLRDSTINNVHFWDENHFVLIFSYSYDHYCPVISQTISID